MSELSSLVLWKCEDSVVHNCMPVCFHLLISACPRGMKTMGSDSSLSVACDYGDTLILCCESPEGYDCTLNVALLQFGSPIHHEGADIINLSVMVTMSRYIPTCCIGLDST